MTQLLDVGPSRIAYTRTGQGPDLVFVHGWPLHSATFRDVVPRLSDGFTCHLFDLPGAGASEWTERTRFSLHDQARAVGRAIERLELPRVGFVAHDSGGAIARMVAAELGDRCFGIVSGNTEIAGYRPPLLEQLITLGRLPGGGAAFRALTRSRAFLRSRWGFATSFDDLSILDGEFGRLFVAPLRDRRTFEGQWGVVRDFDWGALDELASVHRRISAPVLFVWGEDDPWFPLAELRRTLGQFSGGATVEVLPGKVFVHEERAIEFADHARAFLTRAAAHRDAA